MLALMSIRRHRLTRGETNNEIAETLGISPGPCATHIERILSKLNVSTRTAAAWQAWRG